MSVLGRIVELTGSWILGLQSQIRFQILRSKVQRDPGSREAPANISGLIWEAFEWCKWRAQLIVVVLLNQWREERLRTRLSRIFEGFSHIVLETYAFRLVFATLNNIHARLSVSDISLGSVDTSIAALPLDPCRSTSDQPNSPEMHPSVSVCTTASSSFPPSSNSQFKYCIPQMDQKRKESSTVHHRGVFQISGDSRVSPLVSATPQSTTTIVETTGKSDKDSVFDMLRSATARNQPKTLALIASETARRSLPQITSQDIKTAAAAVDTSGYSLLHLAVNTGNEDTLEKVLDILGSNQEQQAAVRSSGGTKSGFTPLHLAAMKGSLKMVERLLSAGADSQALTRLGCTPLHIAAARGHSDICDALVLNGADVNSISHTKSTPLSSAVHGGHLKAIETLLNHGANPTLRPEGGQTALEIASIRGFAEVIDIFQSGY